MFEDLSDATFEARIAEVKAGACIFYKQLCPHCKNMEKVLENNRVSVSSVISTATTQMCRRRLTVRPRAVR